MKKTQFQVLKLPEAGQKVADICRAHSMSEGTFYRRKATYGGIDVNQLHRLQQLEGENRRLKLLVADLTLDNVALKAVLRKSGEACRTARSGALSPRDVACGALRGSAGYRLWWRRSSSKRKMRGFDWT